MLKALFRALQKRSNYFLFHFLSFSNIQTNTHTHTHTHLFYSFILSFSHISFSFSYKKKDSIALNDGLAWTRRRSTTIWKSRSEHIPWNLEIEINNEQKYFLFKKMQITILVYFRCIFLQWKLITFYYYVMRRSVLLRRFHRGMDFQTLERMLPLLYVPSYSHDKLENVEKQTKMDTFLMFNLTRV